MNIQQDQTAIHQQKLSFASDYMEGAHPLILKRLGDNNTVKMPGYGTDDICASASQKILAACNAPDGEVYFLTGGTQTNAVVIDAMLASYQGVIAADTGHVSLHEAGAIEYGGHKVLQLPHKLGKISAEQIASFLDNFAADANHDHMVMPGMVYLSHPTEYGTLYSKQELADIHDVCQAHHIPLYLDGARLAYALACPANELTLPDLARLCDVFYIGGTKCGALLGEAVVLPKRDRIPHFFTIIKQHGALLAKGWLLGIQFDTLFTDNLYQTIGQPAIQAADQIRQTLRECGYPLYFDTLTNQIFVIISNDRMDELQQETEFGFWERLDDTHTVIRFATSWATNKPDTDALCAILCRHQAQRTD